ncbi:MAG: prepilin-type N-terminal cleavage/methylation domain-containing protein [Cyanothece sp. SIO1E1]|nr:prepilin-type N-terminal cleavage/methylation domain-containing protein [Cyanothece sp. SIO1E1]
MTNLIKFILHRSPKSVGLTYQAKGFTLIELLVSVVLSGLVITPLFIFLLNILGSDSKEQAKATSDQEIQSALDYIAQDLEQAVYVYDNTGLTNTFTDDDDTSPGIQDQIPPVDGANLCPANHTCTPVLVFWKRQFLANTQAIGATDTVGTFTGGNDTFVFALVGYYLLQPNAGVDASPWSNVARIGRFEIRDGVPDISTGTFISQGRDVGFDLFNLEGSGTLDSKLKRWQKDAAAYTTAGVTNYPSRDILLDFVEVSNSTAPQPACGPREARIGNNGFFVCVEDETTIAARSPGEPPRDTTLAQVHIRGNALARIPQLFINTNYSDEQSIFFPLASVQIEGRGFLFTR